MRYDTKPIADYDLSSLRVLGSVGNYSKIGNHHNLLLLKVIDRFYWLNFDYVIQTNLIHIVLEWTILIYKYPLNLT